MLLSSRYPDLMQCYTNCISMNIYSLMLGKAWMKSYFSTFRKKVGTYFCCIHWTSWCFQKTFSLHHEKLINYSECSKQHSNFLHIFPSVIDLRWGIRDHSTNDHKTTEICLSEIDKCKQQTMNGAPFFLYLSFNKYGSPSLPRTIQVDEVNT